MVATPEPVKWAPLVYFWEGGWIGVGRSKGEVPPHSHHAVQISIGLDGPVRLRHPDADWSEYDAAVILPNEPHAFSGAGNLVTMIFVDPEAREGRWLRNSMREPISRVSSARLAAHLPALRSFQDDRPGAEAAARIITGVVHALCAGPPPLKTLDPRIAKALAVIRGRDPRRLPLEAVAKEVFLSPSRLAHVFKEELGLPFRRYILWRKLNRAIVEFARGSNLSLAAHAAGFADSAHLTRTWYQMFGISPTVMIGHAEFYEIPAPFELAPAAAE